jgi:hypothetical protein
MAFKFKSQNRRFDGFKTHLSIDPDSELIDEVVVTAANAADHDPIDQLLAPVAGNTDKPVVFGGCAYADGDTLAHLEDQGFEVKARVPPAVNRNGRYSKDDFAIDLGTRTVTCPAGQVAAIRGAGDGSGTAGFKPNCGTCPLAQRCTTAADGRSITIHRHEQILQAHKAEQHTERWQQDYTGRWTSRAGQESSRDGGLIEPLENHVYGLTGAELGGVEPQPHPPGAESDLVVDPNAKPP